MDDFGEAFELYEAALAQTDRVIARAIDEAAQGALALARVAYYDREARLLLSCSRDLCPGDPPDLVRMRTLLQELEQLERAAGAEGDSSEE